MGRCHALSVNEWWPKTVCHRCIGKAPRHIIPVVLVTPTATESCLDATRTVPLVHFVQAFPKAAFRHDHFDPVRVTSFNWLGAWAAFVAGHAGPFPKAERNLSRSTAFRVESRSREKDWRVSWARRRMPENGDSRRSTISWATGGDGKDLGAACKRKAASKRKSQNSVCHARGLRRWSQKLLRFRSCWRLQFIAQLVGAFDGIYDHAIGTRDLVTQRLRTPASFFYRGPGRLSDRGPGFLSALASGWCSPFAGHRHNPPMFRAPKSDCKCAATRLATGRGAATAPCREHVAWSFRELSGMLENQWEQTATRATWTRAARSGRSGRFWL